MKSHYNYFLITLKSTLVVIIFALPMYVFIKDTYNFGIDNYLDNELKLQQALHSKNTQEQISNTKNFEINIKNQDFINNKNFFYLKEFLTKKQIQEIYLELSLKNIFSKAIKIKEDWYIMTFLNTKRSPLQYHLYISKAENIDKEEKLFLKLQTMLAISSIILFILSYFSLLSKENLAKTKKEIQLSLDEANMYFNNAMIAFLIVNKDRKIIGINTLFCKIFGYTKEELLYQNSEILHISKDSYKQWGKLVFEKAQINSVINERYEVKRKDGTPFWIEASGAPFDNAKHISNGVVWTIMDVTEQIENKNTIEKLNKSLHENLLYLRLFLDTAPIPIYVNDKNGLIIECNNAFLKMLKKQKKDVIQHSLNKFLPDYLAQLHAKKDKELLYKDNIYYKELLSIDPDESETYEYHKSTIYKDDIYDGYICVMVNVTEREIQETKLQKMIFEAVQKNKELTQSHEEERLNDIKFTAIGQLAAGITHEINTPLTYLKGNLELLVMDLQEISDKCKIKDQIIEDSLEMKNGINRIASIVEAMREMSQQKKVILESTNIYDTIITSLIISFNRSKQISKIYINDKLFTLDMPKEDITCFAMVQPQRVEQVWIIIINNALDQLQKTLKYDLRELRINCFVKDKKIHILFHDNAGGIEDKMINKIFEPFVSNKPEGGMGIGLSIAKRIINDQDGFIRTYNSEQGAVFEVILKESEVAKKLESTI